MLHATPAVARLHQKTKTGLLNGVFTTGRLVQMFGKTGLSRLQQSSQRQKFAKTLRNSSL